MGFAVDFAGETIVRQPDLPASSISPDQDRSLVRARSRRQPGFAGDRARDPQLQSSLGLTVIAEGIESEAEPACLRQEGCNQGQGFLFGRPRPFDGVLGDELGTTPAPAQPPPQAP